MDCAVGTTDRFLSSVSPFMCVESNSGVADPGAGGLPFSPGTRRRSRRSARARTQQQTSRTTLLLTIDGTDGRTPYR